MKNKPAVTTLCRLLTVCTLFMIAACSSTPYSNGFPNQARWAVMPVMVENQEEAGLQLERMLTVLLASNGIKQIERPPSSETTSQITLVNNAHKLQNANQWALQHAVKLGLLGSIDRWNLDKQGKFTVEMTLVVTDISTQETLWTTSGQGEGRPGDDPLNVTRNLAKTLLSGIPLTEHSSSSWWQDWFAWLPGV